MTTMNDVVFKDVSFAYNREPVLEKVNLKIKRGDFVTIVGPNGGGKTTLARLLLGLLKADSGKVTVLGESPEKSRLKVGYTPQDTQLDPKFPVTVLDVVQMGRLGRSFSGRISRKDRETARAALAEVRLVNMEKKRFSQLSGGQRQRVLIARALSCDPELLLLDEPTAHVDPEVEAAVFRVLQQLNQRMTVMLISHNSGFVSKLVDSVICVNRKVATHPTSELNGNVIKDMYGHDLRLICHDHSCGEGGLKHA